MNDDRHEPQGEIEDASTETAYGEDGGLYGDELYFAHLGDDGHGADDRNQHTIDADAIEMVDVEDGEIVAAGKTGWRSWAADNKKKVAVIGSSVAAACVALGVIAFAGFEFGDTDDPAKRLALVSSLGGGVGVGPASPSAPPLPSSLAAGGDAGSSRAPAPVTEPIAEKFDEPPSASVAQEASASDQQGGASALSVPVASSGDAVAAEGGAADLNSGSKQPLVVAADAAEEGDISELDAEVADASGESSAGAHTPLPSTQDDSDVAHKEVVAASVRKDVAIPTHPTLPDGLRRAPDGALESGEKPVDLSAAAPSYSAQAPEDVGEKVPPKVEDLIAKRPMPPGAAKRSEAPILALAADKPKLIPDDPFARPAPSVAPVRDGQVKRVRREGVRVITVVKPEQIGLEQFAENHILVNANGTKMSFQVNDVLPNGERIERIEIASMTLVTDRSVIRIRN